MDIKRAKAEANLGEWRLHNDDQHWQYHIGADTLDYWPSTNKFRFKENTHYNSSLAGVEQFITRELIDREISDDSLKTEKMLLEQPRVKGSPESKFTEDRYQTMDIANLSKSISNRCINTITHLEREIKTHQRAKAYADAAAKIYLDGMIYTQDQVDVELDSLAKEELANVLNAHAKRILGKKPEEND